MITRGQMNSWLVRKAAKASTPFEQVDLLNANPEVQQAMAELRARWEQTRPAEVVELRPGQTWGRLATVTSLAEARARRALRHSNTGGGAA